MYCFEYYVHIFNFTLHFLSVHLNSYPDGRRTHPAIVASQVLGAAAALLAVVGGGDEPQCQREADDDHGVAHFYSQT